MYFDGTQVASVNVSGAVMNNTFPFMVGRLTYADYNCNMDMNQLLVWTKGLDAEEVANV